MADQKASADATAFVPENPSLATLREAAAGCRGCPLWGPATQTVFGEYITNAVKHFKFEQRGKRRIHQTPRQIEIKACRPWLDEELELLAPEAVVALGATAAKVLLGPKFGVSRERGQLIDSALAPIVTATIHPSAILRVRGEPEREAEREAFATDLSVVARALAA